MWDVNLRRCTTLSCATLTWGEGRTAKISEIAFALKSNHFRAGQIAEAFKILNPVFGAYGVEVGLGKQVRSKNEGLRRDRA